MCEFCTNFDFAVSFAYKYCVYIWKTVLPHRLPQEVVMSLSRHIVAVQVFTYDKKRDLTLNNNIPFTFYFNPFFYRAIT